MGGLITFLRCMYSLVNHTLQTFINLRSTRKLSRQTGLRRQESHSTMETRQYYNSFSTLGLYRYYFEFLKIFGIFPFKIYTDSKTKCVKEISYHKTGVFYFINNFVVSLFICNVLLAYIIVIKNAAEGTGEEFLLEYVTFTMTVSSIAILLITFNLKKHKVCNLLNEWLLVEDTLVRGKTTYVLFSRYLI